MTRTTSLLLLACAYVAMPAHAQIVSGSIVGSLKDPSGAAIPGAEVTARNEATDLERKTVSDSAGNFSFATLPTGIWSVTASHAGFKSATVSHVDLLIDQTARVDMALEIGQISEKVNVQATAAILETETPTLGLVVVGERIADFPLNGRNLLQLATASPGVVPATGTSSESSRLGRTQITAHVAGARGSQNSYLIDGMESRGSASGITICSCAPRPSMS